jgi:hypothetical protein
MADGEIPAKRLKTDKVRLALTARAPHNTRRSHAHRKSRMWCGVHFHAGCLCAAPVLTSPVRACRTRWPTQRLWLEMLRVQLSQQLQAHQRRHRRPGTACPRTRRSVDQVQEWFAAHKLGKWRKHALQFADVDGEELCEMEKEDFLRRVPCNGDIIFNDIAKLKKQVSSSSSESSPGSAAGTAAALNAPLSPCFGCVPCWLRVLARRP